MSATSRDFWWREMRWPTALFVPFAILLAFSELDVSMANALFFDAARGTWSGAHNFWVERFIHTGGRWAIRVVVLAAIVIWFATLRNDSWRPIRRTSVYFIVATVLGIGVVGLLKTITNVDCPWDLTPFGGRFPLVPLFADRPDSLRAGHCFPAAHASSGYALVALYFAFREWNVALARGGLTLGLVCGAVFGIAQQSRGAHFMSHDLWSAFLVWSIAVSVYVFAFAMRLRSPSASGVVDGTLGKLRDRIDADRGCEAEYYPRRARRRARLIECVVREQVPGPPRAADVSQGNPGPRDRTGFLRNDAPRCLIGEPTCRRRTE